MSLNWHGPSYPRYSKQLIGKNIFSLLEKDLHTELADFDFRELSLQLQCQYGIRSGLNKLLLACQHIDRIARSGLSHGRNGKGITAILGRELGVNFQIRQAHQIGKISLSPIQKFCKKVAMVTNNCTVHFGMQIFNLFHWFIKENNNLIKITFNTTLKNLGRKLLSILEWDIVADLNFN